MKRDDNGFTCEPEAFNLKIGECDRRDIVTFEPVQFTTNTSFAVSDVDSIFKQITPVNLEIPQNGQEIETIELTIDLDDNNDVLENFYINNLTVELFNENVNSEPIILDNVTPCAVEFVLILV